MFDLSSVPSLLSAAVAVTTLLISIKKSRGDARKFAMELQRRDEELADEKERHREHLQKLSENTTLILENATNLQATELKLAQYINITQRVFDLDHLFVNNSGLRKYFYDEALVDTSADVQLITAVTEYILDFYSTLQEHERLLSDSSPSWQEWNVYIEDGFRGSPFLCHYFEQNADWYEEGLMTLYKKVAKEKQNKVRKQRALLTSPVSESNT